VGGGVFFFLVLVGVVSGGGWRGGLVCVVVFGVVLLLGGGGGGWGKQHPSFLAYPSVSHSLIVPWTSHHRHMYMHMYLGSRTTSRARCAQSCDGKATQDNEGKVPLVDPPPPKVNHRPLNR